MRAGTRMSYSAALLSTEIVVPEGQDVTPAEPFPLTVQSNTPFKDLSSAKPAAAPHLQGPFPALVLETETNGDNLGTRAVLNSLSATSFCLEFDHTVSLGDQLLVMTQ